MAKEKKEKLSLEELLEQALVKDDDRPYEVHENWVWTNLENVIELISGQDVSVNLCNDKNIGIPYILGASNLCHNTFMVERWIETPRIVSKKNDILISVKGTIGKVYLQVEDRINISRQIMALRALNKINVIYLKDFIHTIADKLKESGNGLIPGITREVLLKVKLPFPPLEEQQRIIVVIESLFEKLDSAKELVQNALDSFENRKTAILHKAFTGELTTKWREENGVSLDEWKEKPLKIVADFRAGHAFKSNKFTDKGYQVVRMGNLYNGVLDLNRNPVFYQDSDIDENILRKSKINNRDILLTLTGTKYKRDYGYAVLIETDKTILFNQRIISLTAKTVEIKYLLNYLKTSLFRDVFFSNETGGVNQGNVSSKFVETILIPVPTIQEQKEIVSILDNLLENEQHAKELCDVIEKIDLMKKAILDKAFRGELGTNDPEEESAVELLKEILKEKI